MHNDDKTTIKVNTKYDYSEGVLEINIPDIIAELSEDDRKELARLHLFDSAMWEELKRCLRTEIASENYNGTIHKLRIELLSGDGADSILRETVRGILHDLNSAKANKDLYRKRYWAIRNWCWDNLSIDQRREMPRDIEREKTPRVRKEDVDKVISESPKEADSYIKED